MSRIVLFPVLELFFDTYANLEAMLGRDRNVAAVEKRVNVLTKQDSVGYGVRSSVCVGLNVGSFEDM